MHDWLHAVALVNPFTNILRLARVGFVGDIAWDDVGGGLLALALLGALAMWLAHSGLAKVDGTQTRTRREARADHKREVSHVAAQP